MEANIKPFGFIWDVKCTALPFTGCMTWDALLNLSSSMKQGSQGSLISLTGRIKGELDKALDTVPGNGKCLLNTGC